MKVGSLFTGIGGFDLGLERAGIEVAWQCEIDPHARAVLANHWPGVPCYDDVRRLSVAHAEFVDIISFGSPCQDLSVAGKRAGMAGSRSGLFFEATRLIKEMREASDGRFPTVAVWENVPGAFSSNGGADFGEALDALADSGAVDIAWRVIDAQHWVPQRRRRVFVVALYPPFSNGNSGIGRAGQILSLPEGMCGNPPARATAGEEVAGTLGGDLGRGSSGGPGNDLDGHGAYVITRRGRGDGTADEIEQSGVAPALRTYGGGSSIPAVAGPITATYAKTADNTRGDYSPNLVVDIQQVTSAANRSTEQPMSPQHQLVTYAIQDTRAMEKAQNGIGVNKSGVGYTLDGTGAQGVYVPDVAYAITAREAKGVSLKESQTNYVTAAARPRRLTPTECERLQGFPDGWTAGQADSHRYKQLGNAVAVPVAEWIGRRIMATGGRP